MRPAAKSMTRRDADADGARVVGAHLLDRGDELVDQRVGGALLRLDEVGLARLAAFQQRGGHLRAAHVDADEGSLDHAAGGYRASPWLRPRVRGSRLRAYSSRSAAASSSSGSGPVASAMPQVAETSCGNVSSRIWRWMRRATSSPASERVSGQQHRELVAAQAEGGVGAADLPQPAADRGQDAVAGRVAVGVVDGLEAVEVDDDQRQGARVADVPGQLALQRLVERAAVAEAGQRVQAARALGQAPGGAPARSGGSRSAR